MKETEKKELFDFNLAKMGILAKVNDFGPIGDMDSWERAFPDVHFMKKLDVVDQTGDITAFEIDWDERTVEDRMFFVAIESSPVFEVSYDLVIDNGLQVTSWVNDPKKIRLMWLGGCFSGEDLGEEARGLFVENSVRGMGEFFMNKSDLDLEKFSVVGLKARVLPF